MDGESGRWRGVFGGLLLAGAVGVAVAGCADIHPAPDEEGGGLLESPTHEQDSLHQEEQRQEQGGRR